LRWVRGRVFGSEGVLGARVWRGEEGGQGEGFVRGIEEKNERDRWREGRMAGMKWRTDG
jgi:hypothetical protein